MLTGLEHRVEVSRQRFKAISNNVIPLRKPPQRASGAIGRAKQHGQAFDDEPENCMRVCMRRSFRRKRCCDCGQSCERSLRRVEGEPPLQTVCSFNAKADIWAYSWDDESGARNLSSLMVLPRSRTEEVDTRGHAGVPGAFSPRVEDRSDGSAFLCVIDIAGTEKLLGSPAVLARESAAACQALGDERVGCD